MPDLPQLPTALIWTAGGVALLGAAALPFAGPWGGPPAAPPRVVAAPPAVFAPPVPGELAAALTRVLGRRAAPQTAAPPPAAGGVVLEGTVVEAGASRALVRAPGELRLQVLAVGEAVGGWTLESVSDGRAAFAAGPRRVELQTPRAAAGRAPGVAR